jgi:Mb-OB3b family methanobactin precursor
MAVPVGNKEAACRQTVVVCCTYTANSPNRGYPRIEKEQHPMSINIAKKHTLQIAGRAGACCASCCAPLGVN